LVETRSRPHTWTFTHGKNRKLLWGVPTER